MNIQVLRAVLSKFKSVGLKDETDYFNYLIEPAIEDDGSLVCYIPSEDDYYYVYDEITRDKNIHGKSWINHLYICNESGEYTLFKTELAHYEVYPM
jgi:hypothetical protein